MKYFIQDNENGYLIQNNDNAILADKMYRLLKNDRIKQNVIQKRDNYIEEFSWGVVADRIDQIIQGE